MALPAPNLGQLSGWQCELPEAQHEPFPCFSTISLSKRAPRPCAKEVRLTGLSLSTSLFPHSQTQAVRLLFPSHVTLPDFPARLAAFAPREPTPSPDGAVPESCGTSLQAGG